MATTTIELQAEKLETSPQQSPTTPRKRRRRAPTTGAAADCFSCQERQSKCDRRRPYCTQCLDQGKNCSGYKTTLTWGVGVASRGKLRGLALPVAKSKKAEQDTNSKPGNTSRKRSVGELSKLGPTRKRHSTSDSQQSVSSGTASAGSTTTTFDFVNMDQGPSNPSPMLPPPNLQWRKRRGEVQSRPAKRMRSHSLEPLQVAPAQALRDVGVMPMTANALYGFRDSQYGPSMQCSPSTPTFSSYPCTPTYPGYPMQHKPVSNQAILQSAFDGSLFSGPELSWSGDSISSSLGSDHSCSEEQSFFADPDVVNSLDDILTNQPGISHQPNTNYESQDDAKAVEGAQYLLQLQQSPQLVLDDVGAHTSMSISTPFSSLPIGNTPGLQFLINYYDRVISPVIVAFDGPTNPYRAHILHLAIGSETLQHAIAALSASNLRMRRGDTHSSRGGKRRSLTDCSYDKSVRRSSMAHSEMDIGFNSLPQTSSSEPSNEEVFYKTASIKGLNEQLQDPKRQKDDSILATLLILCLYHICDTGVAKFKTQFAGVKHILSMRGGTRGRNSKATNWLTVMFTWFDAMTATVNDRESQLPDLDVSSGGDQWALENLAGCDGKLFKIIAKLGRLNLLSQDKPVEASPRITPTPKVRSVSPTSKSQDYYSMNYNRYDGNGWSSLVDDRERPADSRTQFWMEWTRIRKALQDWQLDASAPSAASSQCDRQDLSNISESFRYSALLYTQRLATPHLPSTHPNFQNLVTQALHYITNVKSDVFLLWPLFITGTECVRAEDRHTIRQRCLDIQKDSGFFNNISGLELLENVWRDDTNDMVEEHGMMTGMNFNERRCVAQGFKWRKAMERVDGEYIVV